MKVTQGHESHRELAKRKYAEISHSHDDLLCIVQAMARRDESSAFVIFEQIRAGRSVEALARCARFGTVHQGLVDNHDRLMWRDFLLTVSHSRHHYMR